MPNAKYLLNEIDLSEYNLGTITVILVRDVIKYGEQKINELLTPFFIDYNANDGIKVFDILFIDDVHMKKVLEQLIDSLKMLYKTNEIKFNIDSTHNIKIHVADAIIDKDNYDKLCEVIREMFFMTYSNEDEKRVLQVSEENKKILEEYLRLEQEHKKEMEELNKKNQKNLHQIVTIVASQCLWDYDKVLNMTYYRLINTYMSIFKIDSYQTYMQYTTSGQFDMKNNQQKHWSETVGI